MTPEEFGIEEATSTGGFVRLTVRVPASREVIGIQYSADLSAGSWIDLGNLSGKGPLLEFVDSSGTRLERGKGFYRAVLRD